MRIESQDLRVHGYAFNFQGEFQFTALSFIIFPELQPQAPRNTTLLWLGNFLTAMDLHLLFLKRLGSFLDHHYRISMVHGVIKPNLRPRRPGQLNSAPFRILCHSKHSFRIQVVNLIVSLCCSTLAVSNKLSYTNNIHFTYHVWRHDAKYLLHGNASSNVPKLDR